MRLPKIKNSVLLVRHSSQIALLFIAFKIIVFLACKIYSNFPIQLVQPEHLALENLEFNDIYYLTRGIDDKQILREKDVVLVNTGCWPSDSSFRLKTAKLLGKLESYNPTVIGVDLLFYKNKSTTSDIYLAKEISSHSNIVLAMGKDTNNYQTFSCENTGVVNLAISRQLGNTVRKYYNYIVIKDQKKQSFALRLAKFKIPSLNPSDSSEHLPFLCVYKGYYDGFKATAATSYNNFMAIEAKDIMADRDTVKLKEFLGQKLIILGHLGRDSMSSEWDVEDKYMVPTDSSIIQHHLLMPGAVIHANIIQSLINNRHFYEIEGWRAELMIDVILFLFLILFYLVHLNFTLHKPINLALIFATTIPIIFFVGPWLMSAGVYFQLGSLFIQIAFLEEFLEIAEGIKHKMKSRKT